MQRTPETYQQHLDRRVARCSTEWIVLKQEALFGTEYLIVPKACSSAYCPRCRIMQLLRLRRALIRTMAGHRWRLVTLTFHHRNVTRIDLLRTLASTWTKFIHRVRRRYPNVTFVRTIEIHQDGYPHVHLVVNRYIPAAFVSVQWAAVGGGRADIRAHTTCPACKRKPPCPHIPNPKTFDHKKAAGYLTEEIQKAYQDPHRLGVEYWCARLRSIAVSRNLKLKDDSSPWQFHALAHTTDDLDVYWAQAQREAQWNSLPSPGMTFTNSAIHIGQGYQKEHIP